MARNWKKMSKEEEDKKRQETIDKAIETMNKGIYEYLDSDRFKTLLDTMSKFHDYSMNNTLLILGQNPHATHLAGYNKWQQDFNRQVKRGEKGLMIWMPVEIKVKEKQYVLDEKGNRILGDDGKFKKEEVVVKKHTFKIGYTFDVSQTEQIEGKEVVELSPVKELEGDVKDYQALTKALMEISPVPITIEAFDGTAKGCYNPLTNEIKIQPEMSEVQTIKTMIHEIAHSIVHSNENLDQLKQKENIEFSKSEREVRAESIAYIVSSHLGIDTSDYSFPYVATWGLSTEPSDLENVKQNLKCIKSTSFDLTSKIDTYMEQLQAQQEQNKVNVQIAINWSENGTVAQYSEESNIAPEDNKKSFDAYSWQMVETKSSYVTQLLEGTGDTREFEEDTQNSFSYAEVKAIASGNPIIKEKFEVDNEVKRLETMRRSWQKKKLQAQDDVALLPDRIETEKKYRTILAEECEYFKDEIEANNLRDMEHFTFYDVNGNEYHDLKEAWDAIQECTKGYKLSDYKENKFVGRFMKADVLIGLGLAGEGIVIKMKTPLRTINVDSVNPVGRVNFNRMYKRINDIRYSLNKTIETIQNYEGNLKIAKEMVNKPFELQDELTSARNRQKEINKILDTSGNENSKVVVENEVEKERNESCMEL